MAIDPVKVIQAMQTGLSAVCASCPKYWGARDRGLPGDKCLAQRPCGSPLAGDDFSEYSGDLKFVLDKFCFVCGEKSHYGVRAKNRNRVIGICEEHFPMLQQYRAMGRLLDPTFGVWSPRGEVTVPKAEPKKTLAETMAEDARADAESES